MNTNNNNENLAQAIQLISSASSTVWDATVRQAHIYGLCAVALYSLAIFILAGLAGYMRTTRFQRADEDVQAVIWIVFSTLLVAFGVAFFVSISSVVAAFANPEFWAAHILLNAVAPHN
jgi:uncharacterized membrane protein